MKQPEFNKPDMPKFLSVDKEMNNGDKTCYTIVDPINKETVIREGADLHSLLYTSIGSNYYFKPGMLVRSIRGDYGIVTDVNEKLDDVSVCTKLGQYGGTSITTYSGASKMLSKDEDDWTIGIVGINSCSLTDGEYVRTVIYIGGCTHLCPECHNKDYWDNKGTMFNIDKLYDDYICGNKHITISGGDGLTMQYEQTLNLLKLLKFKGHDVWLYTGYLFEDLLLSYKKECLKYIDVMVDGRYEKDKRDITLSFRGSSNQRIINVQKSLKENKTILYELEEL